MEEWETYFDIVLVMLFAADIVVNFNSAFVSPTTEKLVTDRHEISANYMKFWFWVDSVSTIPFELVTSSVSTSSLRLVKVLRLFRLMKLVRIIKFSKFASRLNDLDLNPSALKLLTLMIQILFIAHLISCAWYYITLQDVALVNANTPIEELPITWATLAGVVYKGDFDKYVHSFYWTITTMLSIGYGDITPTNMTERMYAMCVMMVGGALFGAVIAQVTKFIENRNPQAKEFKDNMDELKAYLREGKPLDETSPLLRKQIVRAYGYYLTRKSTFVESGMFTGLPKENLIELVFSIFDKEVRQVPGLADFSSRHAISFLLLHMQPLNALGGEVIFQQYDVAEEMVLVATGSVSLVLESGFGEGRRKWVIGIADDGDYFGELEYLKNSCRMTTFVAEVNCSLLSIGYNLLDQLEENHTEAYDKFMENVEYRYEAFVRSKAIDRTDPLVEHSVFVNGKFQEGCDSVSIRRAKMQDSESNFNVVVGVTETGKPITDEASAADFVDLFIIHPGFTWKVIWDIFIGILLIWTVVIAPVQIAFLAVQNIYIELFFAAVFFIDMCFNFRTAYFSDLSDAFIVNPKDIAIHYTKTWLFCDVISTIPFDIIVEMFVHTAGSGLGATKLFKSARLLRIMKLVRVSKIRQYMIQLEEWFGISPAVFNIIQMYIGVFFIAHMIACLWWGLSSSMGGEPAWYDNVVITGSLRHSDVSVQYFIALYWTFTTLSTTGYGDITPVNSSEMILCVFVMMLGASVFGYIVANVSALMNQMDAKGSNVAVKLTETTEFLSEKNCPKHIMDKTLKHVKNVLASQSTFDEVGILSRLPTRLRNELLMVQRENVLNKISMFEFLAGNVSMAMYIFNLLDAIYFQNGQVIFHEGDIAHDVFFITSGSVRSYRKRPKLVVGARKASPPPVISPAATYNQSGGELGAGHPLSQKAPEARRHVHMNDTHQKFKASDDFEFLGELPSGSFIGHMALLQNKKQGATAVAVSDKNCCMYALSRADIGRTTRESAHVSLYLQEALAKAIRKQQDEVGRQMVKARRAEALRTQQKDRCEEVKSILKEKAMIEAKEERDSFQRVQGKTHSIVANISSGATNFKHSMSLANLGASVMFGNKLNKLADGPHRSTVSGGSIGPTEEADTGPAAAASTVHATGFSMTQFKKLAAIADAARSNVHSQSSSEASSETGSARGSGDDKEAALGANASVCVSVDPNAAATEPTEPAVNKTDVKVDSEEEITISQEVKEKQKADIHKPGHSIASVIPAASGSAQITPGSPGSEHRESEGLVRAKSKADILLGRDPLVRMSGKHIRGFDVFKEMAMSEDTAFLERRQQRLVKLKRYPSCPEFGALNKKIEWMETDMTAENLMAVVHSGDVYAEQNTEDARSDDDNDTISITRPLRQGSSVSVKSFASVSGSFNTTGTASADSGLHAAIAFARSNATSTAVKIRKLSTLPSISPVLGSPSDSNANSVENSEIVVHSEGGSSAARTSSLMGRRMSTRRERENSIKEDSVNESQTMGMFSGEHRASDAPAPSLAMGKRGRSIRRMQREIQQVGRSEGGDNSVVERHDDDANSSMERHKSSPGSLTSFASSGGMAMKLHSAGRVLPPIQCSGDSGDSGDLHKTEAIISPVSPGSPFSPAGEGVAIPKEPEKKQPVFKRRFSWPSLRADLINNVSVDTLEFSHPLV